MHEEVRKKINELRIMRTKLNRFRCKNANDMRKMRLQYQKLFEDNEKIDSLVKRINEHIDTYFANVEK